MTHTKEQACHLAKVEINTKQSCNDPFVQFPNLPTNVEMFNSPDSIYI